MSFTDSNGRHDAFGGIYQRTNGDLVVGWREAPSHGGGGVGGDVGVIHQSVTTDGGTTWSQPTLLYSDPDEWDVRDVTFFRSSTGTLLLAFFLHSGTLDTDGARSYVLRSTDDGASWSAKIPLNSGMGLWDGNSNPPVELSDGTLLVAMYGRFTAGGGGKQSVVVSRSTDDGLTWGDPTTVIDAEAEGNIRDYQEPALLLFDNGELLCVMRTNGTNFYTSRSTDGGRAWSAPADIGFASNGRPCLAHLIRAEGDDPVVLMYRAASAMRYTTSWDRGGTWETTVLLDNTNSQKSVYGQMIQMADSDHLAVGYFMQQSDTEADARFTYLHPTDLAGLL